MKEADLFEPIRIYLEHQGYEVSSEVKHCDIVARKGSEMVIIEMKTRYSLTLLAQAAERSDICDSVYVATAVQSAKKYPPNFKRIRSLLKRLELGCMVVRFMKTRTRVEIVFHPGEYKKISRHKRKRAIIREIDGRFCEFNKGGTPVTVEKISAYKQECLVIAWILSKKRKASPKELNKLTKRFKAQSILSGNLYGWFDRVERGIYCLNEYGERALNSYSNVIREIEKRYFSSLEKS